MKRDMVMNWWLVTFIKMLHTSSETPRLTRGKLVTHQLVSVKHLKRVLIDDEKRMYLHFVTHLEKASIVVIKHRPPK